MLKLGAFYSADVHLTGLEAMASANQVRDRFVAYGFSDVVADDEGDGNFHVLGRWSLPTQVRPVLPSSVSNVDEVE